MKNNNKKKQLDYGRDIEPIIKKYGLENNDDCKEAVEMIKQNNPEGYHLLSVDLINSGKLLDSEKRTVILMLEKAIEMGDNRSYFHLGILYYSGFGVKRDVTRGIRMIKGAFLSNFFQVFNSYPLDSKESDRLLLVHDSFELEILKLFTAINASFEEQDEVYTRLCELNAIIWLICDEGVSINDFVE